MNDLSRIIEVKRQAEADLLGRPGVTGFDVGYKYVGGKRTDEIALRVHVAKKRARVSAGEKIPEEIKGYKTDVLQGVFELFQLEPTRRVTREPTNRFRIEDAAIMVDMNRYDPVKGGISIGPCREIGGHYRTGTLGVVVKDNATGDPLMLSNFHVLCIDDTWSVGDFMVQPSRPDGGICPADQVGTLYRAALTDKVEGAVCRLTGRDYRCDIVNIGAVAGTNKATLGMPLRKRGRTTGLTYGFVDSLSLTVTINFGGSIGTRTFSDQIGIRPDTSKNADFCLAGDAGSVVVDANMKIVGLYFARGSDGFCLANSIDEVLSALDINICLGGYKSIVKDYKDNKNEFKEMKVEFKEHLKLEKWEIKDHKPEKLEYEIGKEVSDVIDPIDPRPIDPRSITPPTDFEKRLRKLESDFADLLMILMAE